MLCVLLLLLAANFNLLEANSYCATNCSTFADGVSRERGTRNFVSCQVNNGECRSSGVNPTQPKLVYAGWYLYDSADGNTSKIALNFTWGPTHDGTVKDLTGYKINIIKTSSSVLNNYVVHYCLNTSMEFFKHVKANFYHDCYGQNDSYPLSPSDKCVVQISSLPLPEYELDNSFLRFNVEIPTCDDRRLWNVTECVLRRQFHAEISDIVCSNHSITYTYNVPQKYGDYAVLLVCVGEGDGWESCQEEVEVRELTKRNGTISIQLPKQYGPNINFTVSLWGSEKSDLRNIISFSFLRCENSQVDVAKMMIVIVSVIAGCTGICVLLLWHFRKTSRLKAAMKARVAMNKQSAKPDTTEPTVERKSVYVLFVADCYAHERVVANFATFLQEEIGFKVIFELWENRVHFSTVDWMENAMKNADKLVIVLSPKAVELINALSDPSNKPLEGATVDTFTPVVKHIKNDLFRRENLGKYCFVTFDYYKIMQCDVDLKMSQLYRLMDDLETLVFRLTGQEKYRAGGFVQFPKAMKESYEKSKSGSELLKSIEEFDPTMEESEGDLVKPLTDRFAERNIYLQELDEINETHDSFQPRQIDPPQIDESNGFASRVEGADLELDHSGCFSKRLSNDDPSVAMQTCQVQIQPPSEMAPTDSAFASMGSYEVDPLLLEESVEDAKETVTELAPLHDGDEDPLQLLMSLNRLDEQQMVHA